MFDLFKKEIPQTKEIIKNEHAGYYSFILGVVIILGSVLSAIPIVIYYIVNNHDFNTMSSMDMLLSLYGTIFSSLLVLLFACKINKRTLFSLGLTKYNILKRYGLGLMIGFITLSLSLFITFILGGTKFNGFVDMNIPLLILFFIGFMFQGFEEELLCRGFMMYGLSKKQSLFFAMMYNSLFFALLHLGNDGMNILAFMNLFLAGLSFSCMAVYFDDIWVASGAHSMWNYAQGNIFGILVSGMNMGSSIFNIELVGSTLISGGKFGLEGGIGVFVVEILTILVFCALYKKKVKA